MTMKDNNVLTKGFKEDSHECEVALEEEGLASVAEVGSGAHKDAAYYF